MHFSPQKEKKKQSIIDDQIVRQWVITVQHLT